jgi:cellulose synthase/poly-beta-1,6-N-acetylglucosamine synthase-like glycosyltransferase
MRWVFWAAGALIGYTYAGYLAWLWVRSQWRPWPVQRGTIQPRISIVMVVRNEEQVLRTKLENLLELDYPQEQTELVVVSDGSTDSTEAILHEYARNPRVQVVLNQVSQGKASGLNDALQVAQGEIVIFTDARQTIEPGAVRVLLENFADPQVGCVSGELMLGDPATGEKSQGMGWYWRIEKKVRELESASGSLRSAARTAGRGAARDFAGRCLHPDASGARGQAGGVRDAGASLGSCGPGCGPGIRPQGADAQRELPAVAT